MWTVWAITPAGALCSTQVSTAGSRHAPSFGDASVCMGSREDRGICCLLLLLPLGRACEQLVDFCSPDLNPCQHEAQCVGTPDGPRSVSPTASDSSLGFSSFLPPFLICWSGFLRAIIEVAMGTALATQPRGGVTCCSLALRRCWLDQSHSSHWELGAAVESS